jgi:hypothetical protein
MYLPLPLSCRQPEAVCNLPIAHFIKFYLHLQLVCSTLKPKRSKATSSLAPLPHTEPLPSFPPLPYMP